MTSFTSRCTIIAAIALSAGCRTPAAQTVASTSISDSAQVQRDIEMLASDDFEGRRTGSVGNNRAADYLASRYAALRLEPTPGKDPSCAAGCAASYLLPIVVFESIRDQPPARLATQNVAGIIRGTDRALRDEYVVIGAHFDHLGRQTVGAMDPHSGDAIRNGADDNASGSAAVLSLARRLALRPTKRSILITHFSGEEQGLLGSARFVENPPVPLATMVAMVNFDMVGRMRDDKLIVYGVATAAEMKSILDSANASAPLRLTAVGDGFGPSDHSSFYSKDLPVLHFFTDSHEDYHRASDDADKINVAGEVRVIDLAERAVRTIADRPTRLTFTKAPASARAASSPSTGSAYFGSIPDMGASDEDGMRISGVSAGGPAEKAGLKGGDLIVEFGGKPVKNIYDYTDAIGSYKPGDSIAVVVLRGTARERITINVTLTRRGG